MPVGIGWNRHSVIIKIILFFVLYKCKNIYFSLKKTILINTIITKLNFDHFLFANLKHVNFDI